MKRIEAVIRPERVAAVQGALEEIGHKGMTLIDVKGHGVQGGVSQQWRGQEYRVDFLPKVLVLLVVDNDKVDTALDAICEFASTGQAGDGKIFVSDLIDVVRVRTKEHGSAAI